MAESFSHLGYLWRDRTTRFGFSGALLLLVALVLVVILVGDQNEAARSLHYNVYFGIDLFGSTRALWWNVVTYASLILVNVAVALVAIERERLVARLCAWFTAVFGLVMLAGTALIQWYRP